MSSYPGQSVFADAIRLGNHQGAGEWLVRSFAPEVFGLCLAMVRDRAQAEDLSQEVFASAFSALAGFRGEASARTWILKIARNRCIDYLRREKRWSGINDDGDPDEVAEEVSLPHTILSRRADIEQAMVELEEVERALIVLRFSHGLNYEELAAAFGLKKGTTRMRVSRALAKMRDFLSRPSPMQQSLSDEVQSSPAPARSRMAPPPPSAPEPAPSAGGAASKSPLPAPSSSPPPAPRQAPPSMPPPAAAPSPKAPSRRRASITERQAPPAPGSFSMPPPPQNRPGSAPTHVLDAYFRDEQAWLSMDLQVRLRDMAEALPSA